MSYADRDRIEGHIQEQAEARSLYAAKSEAEVIGAAMALPSDCEELFDRLDPGMFGDSVLGAVWASITERQRTARSMATDLIAEDLAANDDFAQRGAAAWLDELRRTASIFGLFEHADIIIDRAGRRAIDRLVQDATASIAKGTSPAELIDALERDLLQIRLKGSDRAPDFTTAGDAAESVLEALDAPERTSGVTTGLAPLDEQLGPLQPGDLILLMGRPSMGKSAAAECIALNMARQGAGVAQLNGEMTKEQMARRHMTDLCFDRHGWAGPKYSDIRRRAVTHEQRGMLGQAAVDLKPLPLLMAKRPGLKLSQLRSMIRRQVALWSSKGVPLGAVIVDHVGLLKSDSKRTDRYEAQTEISNGLKELADELRCVIIGLNQMNRENEKRDDKRPQLSDLRDSGSWEQDADFVVGFYREAYYAERQPEPKAKRGEDQDSLWAEWKRAKKSRVIEAIVLKAREGECGTASLWGDVARNAIRGEAPSDDGWGLL